MKDKDDVKNKIIGITNNKILEIHMVLFFCFILIKYSYMPISNFEVTKMLELSQEESLLNLNTSIETSKNEKIDKFVKERVNEFRCEIQRKLEKINSLIAEVEIEKNKIIVALNSLRTKLEVIENSKKQNSIIKRENKLIRAFRILRENAYLWQEIEKENTIELRNDFGELRGIIEKNDIVKAEQDIFKTKKKYNFLIKIKDILNIKYDKIEANIKANEKEIEKLNEEIEKSEYQLKLKIDEIEAMVQTRFEVEELLDKYKDSIMMVLEKNDTDRAIYLIDIINETNQSFKQLCGDVNLMN